MARTSGTSSDSANNTDTSRPAVKEGGIRVSDILAGGLASAIAAVVGGTLGAVGSVVSAFVVSIVAGITLPLLRRPLRTGEEKLHHLAANGHGTAAQSSKDATHAKGESNAKGQRTKADSATRRHRIHVAVVTTLIAFVLAFGVIFAIQAFFGHSLSTGTGQLQQQVSRSDPTDDSTDDSLPTTSQLPSASSPAATQTSSPRPAGTATTRTTNPATTSTTTEASAPPTSAQAPASAQAEDTSRQQGPTSNTTGG